MPLPSFIRDDRFVLLGLGVATASVLFSMQRILVRYRDASEIKPIQPKTQYITQETEDSLPMTTLNSLLKHYNYSIRETAAKIVCDRAVNDSAALAILQVGITKPDYERRMRNLRALAMLTDQNSLGLLNTRHSYEAFVQSLEHCVNEAHYEKLDDIHYDECYLRDMAEKLCLMFLDQLTAKFGVTELVRAQFVERWLARQEWGDTDEERMENFRRYQRYRENRIADLCRRLRNSTVGRAALERVHLVKPWRKRNNCNGRNGHGHSHGHGSGSGSGGRPGDPSSPGRRPSWIVMDIRDVEGFRELLRDEDRPPTNGTIVPGDLRAVDPLIDPTLAQSQQLEELLSFGDRLLRRRDSAGNINGTADVFASPTSPLMESYGRVDGMLQQARPAAASTEEQRIRRQHREAMVLNDGTRPLRRDDIIEREGD